MDNQLVIRRSHRAKRMLLRVDARSGAVILTLPPRVPEAAGLAFLERQRDWVRQARAQLPPETAFAPGATITILGATYHIQHEAGAPRRPQRHELTHCLVVGGEIDEVANRVRRYLRTEAQSLLEEKVRWLTVSAGLSFSRIRIGDPRSRWGSCSTTGTLSFSWRLIMAPPWVVDYVVAHEVAHLKEMNHSDRFWRLVDSLVPDSAKARHWLREHGPALQRVG